MENKLPRMYNRLHNQTSHTEFGYKLEEIVSSYIWLAIGRPTYMANMSDHAIKEDDLGQ